MFNFQDIKSDNSIELFTNSLNPDVLDCIIDSITSIGLEKYLEYENVDRDLFKITLLDYFVKDDERIFEIYGYSIKSNNGFETLCEVLTRYNLYYRDWKSENPNENDEVFFNQPYTWLGEVEVFVFRSQNKICFFHKGYEGYEKYKIESLIQRNVETQIWAEYDDIHESYS